jgi:hypothetical protein
MAETRTIKIGDVSISMEGWKQRNGCGSGQPYAGFFGNGKADLVLRLHRGSPRAPIGEMVFECPPIWRLYRHKRGSAFDIFPALAFSGIRRILVLQDGVADADLYFVDPFPRDTDPFHGPTMELLMVNYLASCRQGAIIHACGLVLEKRGVLFVGKSGAGKSTLARLWDREQGVDILSDDRIIVRRKGDQFWMYGTPWHGDAKFASPDGIKLERIFLLNQGQAHTIRKIDGVSQVSRLLACSFPPHWDPRGMASTLEILSNLIFSVSCQELTFRPDRGIVDLVRRVTP